MKWHKYLVLAILFMMSKTATARVAYVWLQWKEGIENSEYVFRHDKAKSPRLYDMSREKQNAPSVKVPKSFVGDLEEMIQKGDVFAYESSYQPEEELCGGYVWGIEVRMEDGRSVRSSGHSVLPPNSIIPGLELLMRTYAAKIPNEKTPKCQIKR